MTIYAITYDPRTEMAYTFMTTSIEVVKYSKEYCKKIGQKMEILEYNVKTRGKNFNDVALPRPSKI